MRTDEIDEIVRSVSLLLYDGTLKNTKIKIKGFKTNSIEQRIRGNFICVFPTFLSIRYLNHSILISSKRNQENYYSFVI